MVLPIGKKVLVLKGRHEGEHGKVCRISDGAPFVFINLDKYQDQRVYRDMEFGPYIDSELKALDS